jgi:hypothetical protein
MGNMSGDARIAQETINDRQLVPGFVLQPTTVDDECEPEEGGNQSRPERRGT